MRLRIRFTKLGKVRFTSHRDVARMWERAFRRARLPVAYSEGFSPRPRLSFGLALSVGHESLGEYLDAELAGDDEPDLAALPLLLSAGLPVGMDVTGVLAITNRTPSLQADVSSCTWALELDGITAAEVRAAAQRALDAAEIVTTTRRKGEPVVADIRPGILELDVDAGGLVIARLATTPVAVRAGDVVASVFSGARERRIVRISQWIETDGARREPIEAPDATSRREPPDVRCSLGTALARTGGGSGVS